MWYNTGMNTTDITRKVSTDDNGVVWKIIMRPAASFPFILFKDGETIFATGTMAIAKFRMQNLMAYANHWKRIQASSL